MNLKTIRNILFAIVFVLVPVLVFSQPPGDPNGGNKPVPLTGVELLLLGGGLFGAKRIYDKKRKLH